MANIKFHSPLRNFRLLALTLTLVLALASLLLAPSAHAQEKAPFDPNNAIDSGLGMPSPYDKFLALDQVVPGDGVPWQRHLAEIGVDIDPDAFLDADIHIPLVLGVRIADGVMAVKARDAEALNSCATDIEELARKMGVADSDLERARRARTMANNGEWLRVFMELGFLQQDIMQKIDAPENRVRGDLLIISGWMQGLVYTSTVIVEHYSPETSNFLREPVLAKALLQRAQSLPQPAAGHPLVAAAAETLKTVIGFVDIPIDGSIAKADVETLRDAATSFVNRVRTPSL